MVLPTNLTKRYQHILWATVRHYIATAEPVGSKTLYNQYDFRVAATIRNAMGRLEKAGLLYQPYTSSGRIPSDSGYRIYVDNLMTPDEALGNRVEELLSSKLNWDSWSFEDLLRGAAQIIATLSGHIALITMPQHSTTRLRYLKLVEIGQQQIMLIVVTDCHKSQSILMERNSTQKREDGVDIQLTERELNMLSNFLNSKLQGHLLSELACIDWGELDREFECYADFLQVLQKELTRRSQAPKSNPIMVRGLSEVLRQPEFSQLEQVQMLLHLLEEEQEQLLPLILAIPGAESNQKRVTVRIGAENPLQPLTTCTLISALYWQNEVPLGSVGIIGPTRMLYENAIPLVESAADYLSSTLTQVFAF